MGRDVRGDKKRRKCPVEIYWISGSPFAWRVLLTAEVKGIPYEGKLLEASKGELKTPAFLAINPLGRVPAIRDGNFTLHESLAIMVYLDRKHPNPPLFGRTAEEAGRIFERISEFISDFWPPGQRLIRSIFFGPPLAAEEAKEVREKIHISLARLEECAESGVWMAGPDLTAADIVAYPSLKLLLRASRRPEAVPLALGLDGFETRFSGRARWARLRTLAMTVGILTIIGAGYAVLPRHPDLRAFDPGAMARSETIMWRHYYERRYISLFADLYYNSRTQYGFSPWDSVKIAAAAARAARAFQPSTSRNSAPRD